MIRVISAAVIFLAWTLLGSAVAQVSIPFPGPGMSSGATTCAYISTAADTSNSATYTFTAQNIGTAATDRIVVVGSFARATGTTMNITSVTIGGNTATPIVSGNNTTDGNSSRVAIYALLVTAGTTADIVLNYDTAGVRANIGVLTVRGNSGSTTAAGTGSSVSETVSPASFSLTTGSNGCAIAVYGNGGISSGLTFSGTTTTDFNTSVEAANTAAGAHVDATASGSITVTANDSNPVSPALVAASWSN